MLPLNSRRDHAIAAATAALNASISALSFVASTSVSATAGADAAGWGVSPCSPS